MNTEWAIKRGYRRSFFCPNLLWEEMKKETKGCYSVSQYIRFAVIEKMKREHPEKSKHYDEIMRI
jgi:hypothetical protein